jgi:hypothetical protein
MENPNFLFMAIIGCTPPGRLTEQHDVFFGIGPDMKSLVPQMQNFWPEANGKIHVDAWRKVTLVDGYRIEITDEPVSEELQLFFLNLGGYKPGEFEEFHYKILTVARTMADAVKRAKATSFYKHFGFKGATSHIDDRYTVDVDDIHLVKNVLSGSRFCITVKEGASDPDELHIGYFKISGL